MLTPVDRVLTPKPMLTRPQRIALETLQPAIEAHGQGGRVLFADWKQTAIEAGITQAETRQARHNAFTRAVEALLDAKLVDCIAEGYGLASVNGVNKRTQVYDVDAGTPAVNVNTVHTPLKGCVRVYAADAPNVPDGDEKPLSPVAKTILATVTKEGVAPDDLKRTANHAHPKAGLALIEATINELLLSGAIGRINGKLVAAGEVAA